MKKILLMGLLGVGLAVCCFGQKTSYNELTEQSLNYFEQNEIEKFESTYKLLYLEYLKENLPEYEDAVSAAKKGDLAVAFSNINDLIDDDLFLDEIVNDNNFESLHKEKEWEVLLHRIETIKSNYNENIRLELKDIQNRDQGIRLFYLSVKNDSLKSAVHDYMKIVDRDCSQRVCSILDNFGWLGENRIGSEANETLFLVTQHIDDRDVQDKYLPMLKKAVDLGDAEGWHLAFLTDRILMNEGKNQIYGTQKVVSKDPTKSYIIPLEYPDIVDELRKEIGMPTLAEDLKEEGIHWDLNEYKKNLPTIEKMYKERYESLSKNSNN